MARTPLLRAFQRLAEEHRAAESLGIPPAELRGRRQESAYTRRDFLKRAGVTGAAAATVGPLAFAQRAGANSSPTAPRIAIVGGGIAGLSAALKLADKGVASTVYEAST
ncbi:MAG TPA: NAD(P)-binding protein, partial [Usitatibacter sp.]